MKKLLIILLVICAVLVSGVYLVGEKTERAINTLFSQRAGQEQTAKLISYDRQFLRAVAVSEVTLTAQDQPPVVFIITSTIQHYPYKAVISNKVRPLNVQIRKKLQAYFDNENWLTSTLSINLLGQLTGQLALLPGHYENSAEHFSTKMLQLHYHLNLKDSSGDFNFVWGGVNMQSEHLDASMLGGKLSANFTSAAKDKKSDYVATIAQLAMQQAATRVQLEGIALRGNSHIAEQENRLDSHHEWRIASYLSADGDQDKLFTDNHVDIDLKGLYAPAVAALMRISDDPGQIARGLSELMVQGGEIVVTKLTSQTPWGEVKAAVDLRLQEGSSLTDMLENPFILLDYTSGTSRLLLPDAMLQSESFADLLQIGMHSGLLEREKQTLIMETQLDRGELSVNGRVIPL